MAAKKGNEYWKLRSKHGRDKAHTPESLLEAAYEYFKSVQDNPIKVEKLFGTGLKDTINLARPFTYDAFTLFANISDETYRAYQKDNDFIGVTKEIDRIIYSNKFEGASSGIFNANIIARDLGLADKQEIENKVIIQTKKEIEDELRQLGIEDS